MPPALQSCQQPLLRIPVSLLRRNRLLRFLRIRHAATCRPHGSLIRGLENGLTVSEIKEVLIQLYAYTGFPRSLNGISEFMKVMDERTKAGIRDNPGRDPSPVPADINKDDYGARTRAKLAGRPSIPPPAGYQLFAPAIDTFLKEHLFCDIFIRDNLSHEAREIATVGALASMTGTAGQLRFHMNSAMNTGVTADQMKELISVIREASGTEMGDTARQTLDRVLASRTSQGK